MTTSGHRPDHDSALDPTQDPAMRPLAGRGAVVTGGSRGIGRAVAVRLAGDGAAVALTYRARRDAAEEVVADIHSRGGAATALALDVSGPEHFGAVFDAAEAFIAVAGARGLGPLVRVPVAGAGAMDGAGVDVGPTVMVTSSALWSAPGQWRP